MVADISTKNKIWSRKIWKENIKKETLTFTRCFLHSLMPIKLVGIKIQQPLPLFKKFWLIELLCKFIFFYDNIYQSLYHLKTLKTYFVKRCGFARPYIMRFCSTWFINTWIVHHVVSYRKMYVLKNSQSTWL